MAGALLPSRWLSPSPGPAEKQLSHHPHASSESACGIRAPTSAAPADSAPSASTQPPPVLPVSLNSSASFWRLLS